MGSKIEQLVELYEVVLFGYENKLGMISCLDEYYSGCWDEQIEKAEQLKKSILYDKIKETKEEATQRWVEGRRKTL